VCIFKVLFSVIDYFLTIYQNLLNILSQITVSKYIDHSTEISIRNLVKDPPLSSSRPQVFLVSCMVSLDSHVITPKSIQSIETFVITINLLQSLAVQ